MQFKKWKENCNAMEDKREECFKKEEVNNY